MLIINQLSVSIQDQIILNQLNLTIEPGQIHAIMGPNGSGKTTLANLLARKPDLTVTSGTIRFKTQDLLSWSPEDAAQNGIFLSFQYPIAIPGISTIQFLKSIVNAKRKFQHKPPLDAIDFLTRVRSELANLDLPESLLYRSINDGFSGGEKKRIEMLQMILLEPELIILDETDSGLDIDALRTVANTINRLRSPTRSFILITHYQRLLDYVEPDQIHVLSQGQFIKSGDKSLALELEQKGYQWLHS